MLCLDVVEHVPRNQDLDEAVEMFLVGKGDCDEMRSFICEKDWTSILSDEMSVDDCWKAVT